MGLILSSVRRRSAQRDLGSLTVATLTERLRQIRGAANGWAMLERLVPQVKKKDRPSFSDGKLLSSSTSSQVRLVKFKNETVAIKEIMINERDVIKTAARVQREIMIMSICGRQCPHIVHFKGWYMISNKQHATLYVYIIMESAHTNLHDYILKQGILLTNDARRSILKQVAEALKFMHDAGLVWRDLKPENILVFSSSSSNSNSNNNNNNPYSSSSSSLFESSNNNNINNNNNSSSSSSNINMSRSANSSNNNNAIIDSITVKISDFGIARDLSPTTASLSLGE